MAWLDTPIDKPYTIKNLTDLISQGLLGSMSRFSHFQIVEWCSHFVDESDLTAEADIPISPEAAIALADDVAKILGPQRNIITRPARLIGIRHIQASSVRRHRC